MSKTNAVIAVSPKVWSLAQTLDDLLRHKKFGGALAECYGDEIGSKKWAHFVRKSNPDLQYTFQSEVNAIRGNGALIASLIANDPDFDKSNLIIIEKGGGSREALLAKSFNLMGFFQEASMDVALYSNWERSYEYRQEAMAVAKEKIPHADANGIDVDFNVNDPDISTEHVQDVGHPRIVMEFGSTRGNIPTAKSDARSFADQTYTELQNRFAHDRKICRDGGILIVGSDANQGDSARAAYIHPAHANFAENIVHRGSREGALSSEFNPQLLYYDPIWDKKLHVVRHTLIASADQDFGILSAMGHFRAASIREDDHFVLSHSIKWPTQKMIAAAESQGFKCLGAYWGEDHRVPVYVFKAVPHAITPALKIVS